MQNDLKRVSKDKFGKPIVGDRIGEVVPHVDLDIEKIKVLEGPETAQLENGRYSYYLALGHYGRTFGPVADKCPIDHFGIFLTEFIDQTKYFSNFRVYYHG